MDNNALFHMARYQEADRSTWEGNDEQRLEILWDMRVHPKVGFYRAALVSLLIACTTDIRQYPDKSMYAQECIDLIAELRRDGTRREEEKIARFETHAIQTMKGVEKKVEEVALRRQAKAQRVSVRVAVAKLHEKWANEEQLAQDTRAKVVDASSQELVSEDAVASIQRQALHLSVAPTQKA